MRAALVLCALVAVATVQLTSAQQPTEIKGAPIVPGADEHRITPLFQPRRNITRRPPVWPVNPKTGQRYIGVKEFVIVLHDNVLREARALRNWCLLHYHQERETRTNRIRQKQGDSYAVISQCDQDIAVAQRKIADIDNSVALLRKIIERRRGGLRHALRKIRRIDTNWNITINGFTSQIGTGEQAVRDAAQIRSLLGVSSAPQVVDLLSQGMSRAGQGVSREFNRAIQQMSVSSDVTAMDSTMANLTAALKRHISALKIARVKAIRARNHHILAMRARVEPAQEKIAQLEKMVAASRLTVPDYQQDIDAASARKLKAQTRVQFLENKLQQVNDTMGVIGGRCHRETRNVRRRELTIERLHQVIKQRLIDGSVPERIMLRSVDNILEPYGMSRTPWSQFYDVANTNSPQPNYASLPLRQPPYSVDATRATSASFTAAPYGFPLPAAVDPSNAANNLCGGWEFDEADGNPYAIDSSGYGHDGTLRHHDFMRLKGGAAQGGGNALLFDGVQSYVDLGTLGNVSQSLGQFSVEFRVRTLDTHPALSSILKVVDETTGEVLAIEPNGRVGKRLSNIWPVGQQATADLDYEPGTTLVYLRDKLNRVLAGHVKAPYFDNRWHTIRWVVMNASLNHMAFFMDGRHYPWIASIEQGPSEFAPSFARNVYLGAGDNRGRAEGFFDGALDSVRIYCGRQVVTAYDPCCRVCNVSLGTKACGDMCIALDARCLIPAGCACPQATAAPTQAPTNAPTLQPTATPTNVAEYPQWYRGESIVNEISMFPGNGVLVPTSFAGRSKKGVLSTSAAPLPK